MKKNLHSSHLGQTLVEFALILPVFIFLVVVIFDFGRAIYYYNAIHNAAREGARYGVIHPSTTDYDNIKAVVVNYAVGMGITNANVTVQPGPIENVGNFDNPTIKVTVSFDFSPVVPIISVFMPCGCNQITLIGAAIMRTEVLPSP
ncbi:MAG: TadE family protein [Anaerolineales bacterium]